MERKKVIAGNWKMNKTVDDSGEFIANLPNKLLEQDTVTVILCAPFTSLFQMAGLLKDTKVGLGAQNVYWENSGAYTGEISPEMLTAAGCQYVIIGHSERRQYFGETDETVNKRIQLSLKHGLQPIICIGETLDQRRAGQVESVLDTQLSGAFQGLDKTALSTVTVAYEPIWAIGTGENATPEQAVEAHRFIRNWFNENFQPDTGDQMTILYGGSMKPENAQSLLSNVDIDGGLIGGASLDASKFSKLVTIASSLS